MSPEDPPGPVLSTVLSLIRDEPNKWDRYSLAERIYGADLLINRKRVDTSIKKLRERGFNILYSTTYRLSDQPEQPVRVAPYFVLRKGKRVVPKPGSFTLHQEKALRVMHELYDVGGATVDDIATELWKAPSRMNVRSIRYVLIPYIVAKGAIIERYKNKYRIVELP